MKQVKLSLLLFTLAFGTSCASARQPAELSDASRDVSNVSVEEKSSRGNEVSLWPEGLTIQRPESDKPEEVGRGLGWSQDGPGRGLPMSRVQP